MIQKLKFDLPLSAAMVKHIDVDGRVTSYAGCEVILFASGIVCFEGEGKSVTTHISRVTIRWNDSGIKKSTLLEYEY